MRVSTLAGSFFLVLAAALAGLAPRPAADNSVDSFLRGGDEAGFARYDRFVEEFGSDELVVIALTATSAESALRAEQELTERLVDRGPEVSSVVSASTVYESQTELLLDPDMGAWSNFDRLAWIWDGPLNRALRLLDLAERRAALYVSLPRGGPESRQGVVDTIEQFRQEVSARGIQLRAAGNPLVNLALDDASKQLESTSLPLLIGVCVLVLLLLTRSLRVTVLILIVVGLGVIGGEGLLGLSGHTTNLIVTIAKPLSFVILLATALHIVVAFRLYSSEHEDLRDSAWKAARSKARPAVLALLTTAVGFASLIASPISAMKVFGLTTAASLILGMPLLVLGLPLLLGRFGGRTKSETQPAQSRVAERLVARGRQTGLWLPALSLLLVGLGLASFGRLKADTHAVRYFSPSHPMRIDHEALEASGFGLSTLEAVISSTHTHPTRAQLSAIQDFTAAAGELPGVRQSIDLGTFLREASYRSTRTDALPDDLFIESALEDQADRLAPFFSSKTGDLRVSFSIDTLDADQIAATSRDLDALFARQLGPLGFHLELTGNYPMIASAQSSLIATLSTSIFTTAIVLELIFILALGSLRLGLAALLPNALPVCVNFLVMVGLGVPLDVGTCMTGAIALGIAVDNTLHFLLAYQSGEPLEQTARSTGRAMVTSSVVVAAGFFALTTAEFGPTRNFGLLCASAMVVALAADLLVLPPILDRFFRRAS